MSSLGEDEEEEGGGAGWLVSYADLMTLLFAAFVVLYGLKPEGEDIRMIGVTSNIRESFEDIPDEIPPDERKGPIKSGKSHFQYFKGQLKRAPIIKKRQSHKDFLTLMTDDMKRVKELVDLLTGKKSDKPDVAVRSPKYAPISVQPYEKGFKVNLLAGHFYAPGQYRIKKEQLQKIDRIADVLRSLGKPLIIEGHTDDTIPKGKLTNWDLSVFRATFLLKHLTNNKSFPADLLSAAGYGSTKPLNENKTKQDRMMNRRVEIKVRYAD